MKTLFLFCLISLRMYSQMDYLLIQDKYKTFTCGLVSDSILNVTTQRLEQLDTSTISKNIDEYYHDLGSCYYRLFGKQNNLTFLNKASESYNKALFHNPKHSSILWNLALFNYAFYRNCEQGQYYLNRFKKATKRKNWKFYGSQVEINQMKINCN